MFRIEFRNYGIEFGARKAPPGGSATISSTGPVGAVSRSETGRFDPGVPFLEAKRPGVDACGGVPVVGCRFSKHSASFAVGGRKTCVRA